MVVIRFAFLVSLLVSSFASAGVMNSEVYETPPSAMREPNESSEEALNRQQPKDFVADPASARGVARPYSEGLDARAIPEWTGRFEDLQTVVASIRDERLYLHQTQPDFLRRSTWLYPVDGCYARAEHVSLGFEARGLPRPGKVLAFGRLAFRSTFGPSSTVYWSYHIAAAFRFRGEVYVLDPVAHPTRPLHFEDWLGAMTADKQTVKISGCGENTYSPASRCLDGKRISYEAFAKHQMGYMEPEWNRLLKAQLDPVRVLGDEPPWATTSHSEGRAK
jgi:hypothetical protein